ncbi:hypothetical protein BGW80DRAFT_1290592 [Lactifluus volemus]|nr:hypothetical protein BGW80DRAFT_1290592 [Lactifluus volemus]
MFHLTQSRMYPNDLEHAYLLCSGACYVLLLQMKTRPSTLVYFDSSSAFKRSQLKMEDGPLDSPDIVTWGNLKPQ